MQGYTILQLLVVAAGVVLLSSDAAALHGSDTERGSLPQMPFYHRFSQQVRQNAEKSGAQWTLPALNTPEYHQLLVHRDLVRHGRNLATAPKSSLLTFYSGNLTTISSDGLHYVLIDIGTPSVSYFVALDTGSDLFWLPCECQACAPSTSPAFEGLPSLNVYAPSKSSSSKAVTCGSADCDPLFSSCQDENLPSSGQCAYKVAYGSANTSSSGTIYQDDIHLTPNSGADKDITSPILLGCGQTQTGGLVDGTSVPDGLIGLGLQPFSVPSVLAQSGLVADSFSVCFALDGSGRIVFGDFGSPTQATTPFQADPTSSYTTYQVEINSITVGNDSVPASETALFDTGTTVTFLSSTIYKGVIDSFTRQTTKYKRVVFDNLFDVCYATSNRNVDVPRIDFEFAGKATFPLISAFAPYFYAANNSLAGFCLALLDGGSTNIFGVNFMLGYNLVFDRQDSTLSFEQSDCSSAASSTGLSPVGAPEGALSPTPSAGGGPSPPSPLGEGGPTSPRTPAAPRNSTAPRIPVSLLSVFSLGLLATIWIN